MRDLVKLQNGKLTHFTDSLNILVDKFLAAQDVKASSKETYRRSLRNFLEHLNENRIKKPTFETILAFKASLIERGLSSLTVNSYLVVCRKFFAFLDRMGIYPNIAKDIKGIKGASFFMKDPLSQKQIKELFLSIDTKTVFGKRDYAILNLMVRTGLRSIEVCSADVGDIRQYDGEVLLYVRSKGRDTKDEFVLLTKETINPILAYLKERDDAKLSAPLFASESNRNRSGRLTTRSIRGLVKKYLRGIGLDHVRLSSHSLRHTFATLALSNGAPVMQVKEALRHKDIQSTMVYAHMIDRLKNAAEKYINF
jgi:integrase/recombinase XerC/integrase/recombinase XerD